MSNARLDPGMIMMKMTNLDERASLSHLDKENRKNDTSLAVKTRYQ